MSPIISTLFLALPYVLMAQQPGHMEQESPPTITLKECTLAGGCTSKQAKVTLDANWRWVHSTSGYTNCYTGNAWDSNLCPDNTACAQNCALEGVTSDKYANTYGITQIDNGVKLRFVTEHEYGVNVGSRLYMLDDDDSYKLFYLKNREFAMDFDVSHAFCGMNGAMYFIEMDKHGEKGNGNNQAGAKYGTGYCDAQCPHDIKFIDGYANVEGWVPNPKDKSNNMGTGKYGACCAEMDIWEANSMANAYTPHPCNLDGRLRCEGIDCGDNDKNQRYMGVCDKDGCDINPFRMGNKTFYGRGPQFTVDTTKPMTVVTQFLTTDGTDTGDLSEIRRFYVQNGKTFHSPPTKILDSKATDSITDQFCKDKKELFKDVNDFEAKGGNKKMGDSLDRGHVLAVSLWDDVEVNMLWLDSAFPLDKPKDTPGVLRGNCTGGESSTPTYVRNTYPDGWVSFANAAVGEIGSTLMASSGGAPSPSPGSSGGGGSSPEGCTGAPGQNQPECGGKSEHQCKHMIQSEGKCQWVPPPPPPQETPVPVPAPTPPPPQETPVPVPAPTPKPGPMPCSQFCGKPNVQKCQHVKNSNDCHSSYTLKSDKATPCVFKGGRCKNNRDDAVICPGLKAHCEGTEPEPEPEPEQEPEPEPEPVTGDCTTFCSMTDLTTGNKGCGFLKNFPKLCKMSYVMRSGLQAVPCKPVGSKCTADVQSAVDCSAFEELCNAEPVLLEIRQRQADDEEDTAGADQSSARVVGGEDAIDQGVADEGETEWEQPSLLEKKGVVKVVPSDDMAYAAAQRAVHTKFRRGFLTRSVSLVQSLRRMSRASARTEGEDDWNVEL